MNKARSFFEGNEVKSEKNEDSSNSQIKSIKVNKIEKKDAKELYEEIQIPNEISAEIREGFLILKKNDKAAEV